MEAGLRLAAENLQLGQVQEAGGSVVVSQAQGQHVQLRTMAVVCGRDFFSPAASDGLAFFA